MHLLQVAMDTLSKGVIQCRVPRKELLLWGGVSPCRHILQDLAGYLTLDSSGWGFVVYVCENDEGKGSMIVCC